MKRIAFIMCAMLLSATVVRAQRVTDKLDRGLVAMQLSDGVLLTWRIFGEEYYDTEYNVYRNGTKLNSEPLNVSNYKDSGGRSTSKYTVKAVVNGVEQEACKEVTPWSNSYKEINLTHEGIQSRLCPNDATCADVDGDGELEILLKYDNIDEAEQSYPKYGPKINGKSTGEYSIFECLKLDGTRLWWINCGPNMGDFQNNEQNIMAYDWDGDGKAEAVMRACDGTVVHMKNGSTYTVGNATANVRGETGGGVNWFVTTDGEYLLYMNGATGEPYQCIPYPLKRLESGETDLNRAWGDGYGHRCSKHFFGAPYLDGKNPSIFLARGIYTRHKMIAYDVNPTTHELTERWRWYNNSNGPWKGQGFHNYCVADVDMDGKDEIVYGSMVIDDNGKGLSTTALGHGDAQHTGDFNPYIHGLEIYTCQEDNPGNVYRDGTTAKIYHRYIADRDDGRSMAGNFCNDYPGGAGCSAREGLISLVRNEAISGLSGGGVHTNFRIYWDGDLQEETFNDVIVSKYPSWDAIYTCEGAYSNNGTKATPCYQGDILGDWREEIIERTANNNIRIYSTPTTTKWRNYTLWHDHQYRNAMVWQMCGYNQPPHCSYFLGQLEDITVAPPPLTTTDRKLVSEGGTIGTSRNGYHVLVAHEGNSSVTIEDGAQPSILTFNVSSWVQGSAPSECTTKDMKITYTYYTCTVNGGGIAGNARLIKQGDGTLKLPKADFTHTGETNVWGGKLSFDGKMVQSPLWLNRHTELDSDGGEFLSIKADYGSVIRPGGADNRGDITTDRLEMGFGSRLVIDLYGEDVSADVVNAKALKIERKTGLAWTQGGPKYLMPVVELVGHFAEGATKITPGKYVIANVESIDGSVDNIKIEGLSSSKKKLYEEDGKLIVEVFEQRDPSTVYWTGSKSNVWDVLETDNFLIENEETGFVPGDDVIFGDKGEQYSVSMSEDMYPNSIVVSGEQNYTIGGKGNIAGTTSFTMEGTGTVSLTGDNSYVGGNYLKGGVTKVTQLANQYSETGNLGGITTQASLFTMENGAVLQTSGAVETASPIKLVGDEGGVINNSGDFRMNAALSGTVLTKRGAGALFTMKSNSLSRIIVEAGGLAAQAGNPSTMVELRGGTLWDDAQATSHNIYVPEGKSAAWQLSYTNYTAYSNRITGKGTLTIVPRNTVQRVRITGNWSQFEGTIKHTNTGVILPLDMSSGMPNGTLDIAEGCTVSNVCKAYTIGKVTGKGSLIQPVADFQSQAVVTGNNTWNIGNSWETEGDFTFEGKFSDGGGTNKCIFNKIGTCVMTVGGPSDNTGATTVKEGELRLKSGGQLGKGSLTVQSGAILSGSNTASVPLVNSSVSIQRGGKLQIGQANQSKVVQINFGGKNVTLASGSTLALAASRHATRTNTGAAYLSNIGTLNINATIDVYVPATHTLAEGDSVIIWKDVTTVKGSPALASDVIDEEKGLYWDTTDLMNGILRVEYRVPSVINGVVEQPDEESTAVYDLNGRMVAEKLTPTLKKGFYIYKKKKIVVQ